MEPTNQNSIKVIKVFGQKNKITDNKKVMDRQTGKVAMTDIILNATIDRTHFISTIYV